ncbi:hypothetical protein ACWGI0_28165 [Streptomyces sp. NPDC054802]
MSARRTTVTALMAAAAVTGTLMSTAAPAHAATAKQCSTTSKSFNLPGKPDVRVSATLCIQRTGVFGGYRYYKAWLSKVTWNGTSSFIGGTRFNHIDVLVRAEHGRTRISNCAYGICERNYLTSMINDREKGSKTYSSGASGYGIAFVKTRATNWTADATASFDIANDGIPTRKWELRGTRTVR